MCDVRVTTVCFPKVSLDIHLSTIRTEGMNTWVGCEQIVRAGIQTWARGFVESRANLCITEARTKLLLHKKYFTTNGIQYSLWTSQITSFISELTATVRILVTPEKSLLVLSETQQPIFYNIISHIIR